MRNAHPYSRGDRFGAGHALLLLLSLVGSALLIGLAAKSGRHPYIACVGLVPLFVAIRVCHPIGALLAGAAWGLSLFAVSPAGYGPADSPTAASLPALTLAPAIYACVGSVLTRWIGFSPFVLSVVWLIVDAVGSQFGLTSQTTLGRQWDDSILAFVANLFGYAFVGWAAAFVCSLFVAVVERVPLSFGGVVGVLRAAGDVPRRVTERQFDLSPHAELTPAIPRGPPIGA